jgi:hypothetical protein
MRVKGDRGHLDCIALACAFGYTPLIILLG